VDGCRLYGFQGFYLNYSEDEGAYRRPLNPPNELPNTFLNLASDVKGGLFLVSYGTARFNCPAAAE
jgi:hypothetical protein